MATVLQSHNGHDAAGRDESQPDLGVWIRDLYEAAGGSDCLFASPLGPIAVEHRTLFVPQLVYFGPNVSPDPVRLAVLSGFDPASFCGSRAVLALVSDLIARPDIGQGLSVSFFPVVNARIQAWGDGKRSLAGVSWRRSKEPEIALLRKNVTRRHYQGFITLRSSPGREPAVTVRTVLSPSARRSSVEVYTKADFEPWASRFETVTAHERGPLTLARSRDYSPFEVEISVPVAWDQARWDRAIVPLLKRLLVNYRGFISYGGSL